MTTPVVTSVEAVGVDLQFDPTVAASYLTGSFAQFSSTYLAKAGGIIGIIPTNDPFVPAPSPISPDPLQVAASDSSVFLIGGTLANAQYDQAINRAGLNHAGSWTYHLIYDLSPNVTVAPFTGWTGTEFTNGNGAVTAGHVVTLVVNFNENVFVDLDAGNPTLSLNDGGTATYVGGSGTNALIFDYLVQPGETTSDLTVTSFNLNTAHQPFFFYADTGSPDPTVHDAAGNAADLSGAVTNPAGVLEIGIVPPTVVSDHDHATVHSSVTENAAHGVLANDTDPIPSDVLTVSAVNGNANNVGHAVQGLYGSLTLNSDGGYTYNATHGASLPGDGVGFDTFTYTAKEAVGDTASTDLTVVVVSSTENYVGGVAGTTINGANFKFGGQVLDGSLGGDTLLAGKTAAVEIGGPGDTLTGTSNAADQFVFHGTFGSNEITNFTHNDGIWLDHTDITNFQQLMADASQANANAPVIINDHAGDILQLDNVQLSALHSSNFHFIV